jgi:hypothetical protein
MSLLKELVCELAVRLAFEAVVEFVLDHLLRVLKKSK